jgi:hypothetical protein
MDSLVDLVCFYYRKAMLKPTPKIFDEVKLMPSDLYEHICAMPTMRPTLYYRREILTDNNTFKYDTVTFERRGYFMTGVLQYPLRTDISKPMLYYYRHSYTILPGNIRSGLLILHRYPVPNSIAHSFDWSTIADIIVTH